MSNHPLIVRGIQIVNLDSKSQGDRYREETVCFEDGKGPTVASAEDPADRHYDEGVEGYGRVLSIAPPPNCLEDYPTQPELMCGGQMVRYTVVELEAYERPIPQRGGDIRSKSEDGCDQQECWFG